MKVHGITLYLGANKFFCLHTYRGVCEVTVSLSHYTDNGCITATKKLSLAVSRACGRCIPNNAAVYLNGTRHVHYGYNTSVVWR